MTATPPPPKVFISYSTEDRVFARRVVEFLKENGVNAWLAGIENRPGDSWVKGITEALKEATHMVVLLSEASLKSKWVDHELNSILAVLPTRSITVIPTLLDDVEVPPLLKDRTIVNFRPDARRDGWSDLLRAFSLQEPEAEPDPENTEARRLRKKGPPTAMPASSFGHSNVTKIIPFDLGAVWGLDRSSFIGVLSGGSRDEVYDGLQRTERALSEATEGQDGLDYPARRWTEIDPRLHPDGPNSLADVWNSQVAKSDAFFQPLKDNALPDSDLLGLFLELPVAQSRESLPTIRNWCRRLVELIPQLAVVIHASGPVVEANEMVSSILEDIRDLNSKVRVEGMILRQTFRPAPHSPSSGGGNAVSPPGSRRSFGFAFCSWVERAKRSAGFEWSKDEEKRYSAVLLLFNEYLDSALDYMVETSAEEVVADLESIGLKEVNRQLLSLVEQYLPEQIYPLVSAYARSDNREIRRTALVFASHWDSLMDAWVEGNELEPGRVPEAPDLIPDPNAGLIVEHFVLALLRRFQKGKNRDRIKEYFQKQQNNFNPELRAVIGLCVGEVSAEQFVTDFGAREFRLVVHTDIDVSLPSLKDMGLDRPDFWWLLAALPPNRERIGQLLQLPPKLRAVFGLCTGEEWQDVTRNKEIERQVFDCRQQRRVVFHLLENEGK